MDRAAEVHFIGQIDTGEGFGTDQGLFVVAHVESSRTGSGENDGFWSLAESLRQNADAVTTDPSATGSTQTQTCVPDEDDICVWAHPIDLHYVTSTIASWPRMRLSVYTQDQFGRVDIKSYATMAMPSSPGHHEMKVRTWSVVGSPREELVSLYGGGSPMLSDVAVVDKLCHQRHLVATKSSGYVNVSIDVITREFGFHDISSS
eukprot:gene985-1103_t